MNGIIFDMDGTLGDTMPMILRALQETFARFAGREYTPAEIIDMFGPTEEGLIRMRVPQAESQTAVKYYIERYAELHTSMTQPFPGVIQLLEALQRRGIRRGLVTGKGPLTAEI
ncbi:MAG TPA: HAD hydrolase-like protein, partial [Anaerolineales bacterium]